MQGDREQMRGRLQQTRGLFQRLSGTTTGLVGMANQSLGGARATLGQVMSRYEGSPWAGIGAGLLAFTVAAGLSSLILFPSMRQRMGASLDSLPGRSRQPSLLERLSDSAGDLLSTWGMGR
jgi:hypothetical protein